MQKVQKIIPILFRYSVNSWYNIGNPIPGKTLSQTSNTIQKFARYSEWDYIHLNCISFNSLDLPITWCCTNAKADGKTDVLEAMRIFQIKERTAHKVERKMFSVFINFVDCTSWKLSFSTREYWLNVAIGNWISISLKTFTKTISCAR